jgi:hypothetical protein
MFVDGATTVIYLLCRRCLTPGLYLCVCVCVWKGEATEREINIKWAVRHDFKFCGNWARDYQRWQGLIALVRVNYRPVFSSERASHTKKCKCLKIIPWKRKKNCPRVPNGGLIPGHTGRLTVGRKIILTSILIVWGVEREWESKNRIDLSTVKFPSLLPTWTWISPAPRSKCTSSSWMRRVEGSIWPA